MIEVSSLSAYELSLKLKSGEISSIDLCKSYIDRIKKFEKDVKAWQFFDEKLLLEKAEEADDYRKSGKPLGPLHGMPIAIPPHLAMECSINHLAQPRWITTAMERQKTGDVIAARLMAQQGFPDTSRMRLMTLRL